MSGYIMESPENWFGLKTAGTHWRYISRGWHKISSLYEEILSVWQEISQIRPRKLEEGDQICLPYMKEVKCTGKQTVTLHIECQGPKIHFCGSLPYRLCLDFLTCTREKEWLPPAWEKGLCSFWSPIMLEIIFRRLPFHKAGRGV